MKRLRIVWALAGLAGASFAAYGRVIRPWHVRWGATDDDVRRSMPLDRIVERPTYVTNRAVTIRAQPGEVWPWLAQIGEFPRGGFYSYDWIERVMGMRVASAEHILPEFQQPQRGDALDRAGNLTVRALEPGRWLVLGPPEGQPWGDATWCLALYPADDGSSRLVSRVRVRLSRWTWAVVMFLLLDPGQFIMERRMLLGVKRRAEALAAARQPRTTIRTAPLLSRQPHTPEEFRTACTKRLQAPARPL
ncbi:MAG TPA: SRPBCC family protein [Dehalococcoidia bacterium]|nr:SRPBCC family protein [Dehalococcoidia bacterium]